MTDRAERHKHGDNAAHKHGQEIMDQRVRDIGWNRPFSEGFLEHHGRMPTDSEVEAASNAHRALEHFLCNLLEDSDDNTDA